MNKKQFDINFNGEVRTLRFNNYMVEHLTTSCAGGDFSKLGSSLKSLLAQSSLLMAAHIVDAALSADDWIMDRSTSHDIKQCKEYVANVAYADVIKVITAFNESQDGPKMPGELLPATGDVPEMEKKRYRGKKS
jgi:hypothetical protein